MASKPQTAKDGVYGGRLTAEVLSDVLVLHTRKSPSGCIEWTGSKRGKGYGQIYTAGVMGFRRQDIVSRVAFGIFVGPIPDGLQVLHRCDNQLCCNPVHLFLGTNAENLADMRRKGRHSHGVRHRLSSSGYRNPNRKLTVEEVREIRRLCAAGQMRQADIGAMFGIRQATVSGIHRRKAWWHVEGE
jgi:hypothetical protein